MTVAVVSSFNEWDPLEEVIVGRLEGAVELPWDVALRAIVPDHDIDAMRLYLSEHGGRPKRDHFRAQAQQELDGFIRLLESEGVVVKRPDPLPHDVPFATPQWKSIAGNGQSDPRDVLIVIGDEILEATMAWRSRYFEVLSYRRLIKEYFNQGARWAAAPKPQMTDELYKPDHVRGEEFVLTNFEPVFDAADITRCGRDLFVQKSNATNEFGVAWLRRHLGDAYSVHMVEFDDARALHIDATFVPLAPGKVLVNPDRPIKQVPDVFMRGRWEFLTAPRTTLSPNFPLFANFEWLSMNMLSLDEKRIIVEENEEPLMKALEGWGFEPIPCPFRNNYRYGGSFHCATVDIRRRGTLQSYF
jgi:glycine amidinotransferase